ncbi:MAG: family 78 glycoside hydrolase catalytic domain, partial [Clostridia bacterium]|nr:family 78 glycoside hydrolase catalytic domain [Clostridia bacterium]
ITTKEFSVLQAIDVYHKEYDRREIEKTPEKLKNNHCYFRKSFIAEKNGNYSMNITADDYYKLYINGSFVCQGPASSRYDKYYYNTIDITPYINSGENVIAVHVYYQGHISHAWSSGDNRQGLIADVLKDDKPILGTDESWVYDYAREYVDSEITGYETQYLENIDFNLAVPNWTKLEFDDSDYIPAIVDANDDHIFFDCVPTVQVYSVYPKEVKKLDAGHLFIDMGKEYTGQIHFVANGEKGQQVIIRCGEETIEGSDNQVRYEMRCNCKYEEICTLSGKEDEFLFYDYKTFRYVEIITDTDCIDADAIDMIVRHHKFECSGFSITSTDKLIENIWEICANALMISVQEGYLDCPSREKGQYLGDFVVSGLAHLYLTGDRQMYRKALIDFANSCTVCKGMMTVAPGSLMQEIADFSLLYPLAVANYFKYTNDEETVRKLMPVMDGILNHFEQFRRNDGLLEGVVDKWNLVDWPKNLRDNYDFDLTQPPPVVGCHNVINAHYYCAVKTVEELKTELEIEFELRSVDLAEAFIKEFYKEEIGLFTDTKKSNHTSLHSNVLPAYLGIVPEKAKENVRDLIMQKGLCCGVWFSYFVLKALGKLGAYAEEYEIITNKSEQSWYNMIAEGATTCYEAWGKEQKINTSLCHPWASSPIIAIIEDIAGIRPESFHTSLLLAESHIPEGLGLKIKLPCKNGNLEFSYMKGE